MARDNSILCIKLNPLKHQRSTLVRPRIDALLHQALDHRMTIVQSTTGCGKSNALFVTPFALLLDAPPESLRSATHERHNALIDDYHLATSPDMNVLLDLKRETLALAREEKSFAKFADAIAFISRYVPLGNFVFKTSTGDEP